HPAYYEDLSNFSKVQDLIDMDLDMIVGGPPCQDFSTAGKRTETPARADLTVKFAEIVTSVSPRYFVMENVARVETSKAFNIAKTILENHGYGLTSVVLDASKTGVPQKRKRFFMFGEMDGPNDGLLPYFEKNLSPESMTLRDYFGDSLGLDYYYRHPRNYNRRGVYSIDEPYLTVRGVNRPVHKGYKGHPADACLLDEKIRPLTSIERSYIQTFPEGFFSNDIPKTHLEQMIGNAVPVNLARYVALCIEEYLSKDEAEREIGQLSFFNHN